MNFSIFNLERGWASSLIQPSAHINPIHLTRHFSDGLIILPYFSYPVLIPCQALQPLAFSCLTHLRCIELLRGIASHLSIRHLAHALCLITLQPATQLCAALMMTVIIDLTVSRWSAQPPSLDSHQASPASTVTLLVELLVDIKSNIAYNRLYLAHYPLHHPRLYQIYLGARTGNLLLIGFEPTFF